MSLTDRYFLYSLLCIFSIPVVINQGLFGNMLLVMLGYAILVAVLTENIQFIGLKTAVRLVWFISVVLQGAALVLVACFASTMDEPGIYNFMLKNSCAHVLIMLIAYLSGCPNFPHGWTQETVEV